MAAQTISLKSAFAEADRLGISASDFKSGLTQIARHQALPATAGYWQKVGLYVNSGDTLADALRGTNLSLSSDVYTKKERALRRLGKSHHWYHDQCHTFVFTGSQWLVYATNWRSDPLTMFYIPQSCWDMDVSIIESRGMILFEYLQYDTRFEASIIDFDLREMKKVWSDLGPSLKVRLGRPPKYEREKQLATNWMMNNLYSESPAAFKLYVQSLFPDEIIPKESMRKVFMPIWNEYRRK